MKKLLTVLVASALFVPAFAGSILNNVETYGEIQTIGTLSKAAPGYGKNSDVSSRLLFGLGMDLVEDVKAQVTFLNSNYWGNRNDLASSGPHGSPVQSYFYNTQVAEANVTISNVFNAFEVKVGRQFYGDENSAIIYFGPSHYKGRIMTTRNPIYGGPQGYVSDSRAMDAAVVTYNNEKLVANVVYAKLYEDGVGYGDFDTSMLGFDAKYMVNDNLTAQAYLYNFRDPNYTTLYYYPKHNNFKHLGIWGVKGAYTDDAMNLGLEYAKNYGGDELFFYNKGWMLKVDASMGFKLDAADVTPRITYVHTEQNFWSQGNYAPGIVFGGDRSNLLDGRPVRVLNIGVDFKFAALEKFSFALDYIAYNRSSMYYSAHAGWVGNEFDLMAKYAVNEYVELHGGAAYLTSLNDSSYYGWADGKAWAGQLGMIVKF